MYRAFEQPSLLLPAYLWILLPNGAFRQGLQACLAYTHDLQYLAHDLQYLTHDLAYTHDLQYLTHDLQYLAHVTVTTFLAVHTCN
jgi:hypothetical protein